MPSTHDAVPDDRNRDILISINCEPISSREGVINYLRKDGKGKKQYIVVLSRNGQRISRTYTR